MDCKAQTADVKGMLEWPQSFEESFQVLDSTSRRGMYFEEFEVGQTIKSPGRTITESDIVSFAGLSGDYNPIHIDKDFSSKTPYERRIAHGLLGLSVASGLAFSTGILEGTVIAFRGIEDWKFSLPIFIGDTIHVKVVVEQTKALPRLGGGSIVLSLEVINQKDESLMKGKLNVLVTSKPEE